jgi:stearoyl-CoA desaturase (delta-9 desaturase)
VIALAPKTNESPSLESSDFEKKPKPPSLAVRVTTLVVVIVPFLGVVAAGLLFWGWGFTWHELGVMLVMYAGTVVGIGVGFHRLFTHRSFETHAVVQVILGVLGSMAVQGPLLEWVAYHRRHHQLSDQQDDPHSPHHHGTGILGLLRGFWHAHVGWFFQPDPPNLSGYVKDLRQSPLLRTLSALFPLWVVAGLLIPMGVGLLLGGWPGALLGLIWGGLVRVFFVHHVTWSINSVCHLWGSQAYRNHDESRNNLLFGVLGFGEGWHNNHHAFPTSARHGLKWWQIDVNYWTIRLLALLGLAWNVKLPSTRAVAPTAARPQREGGGSNPDASC